MSYRLVNLNPHEVVLIGDGQQLVLPPSGTVPRLVLGGGTTVTVGALGAGDGTGEETPVTLSLTYGEGLVGLDPPLPDPQPGVLYVTSRVVAEHCPQRDDLAWPHELVRDTAGRPVGARGLATVGPPPGQSGRKSLP
ncbi:MULTISPECIES: hypothetical protein [unclassified Actinomyces]|uniref:hypothetical protein n=1 Tax=unclassified Actinomyces TaxID=2609248 RepID=UPI00101AED44|nr:MULTISPECIES: hypothetical protein [unclassified Actinomyces]QQO77259.1 hypothetical protein JJJ15_09370 [Actinomyces sp. HMT897]